MDERTPMVVSGATATVLMSGDEVSLRLAEIRAALSGPEPLVAFLSSLTASGVRNLPSFACIGREADGVRLLLRGCTSAVARSPEGDETVHDAGSVSTWVEAVAAPCAEVELRWDGVTAALVTFGPASVAEPPAVPQERPSATGVVAQDASDVEPRTNEPAVSTAAKARPLRAAPADVTRPPDPIEVVGGGEVRAEAAGPPPSPVSANDGEEVDLSHLFETRHVGVEAAAVRDEVDREDASDRVQDVADQGPAPLQPEASAPPVHLLPPPTGAPVDAPPPPGLIAGVPRSGATDSVPGLGDHDGLTISPAQAAALRRGTSAASPSGGSGTQLQAVACPAGHLNPPQAAACRSCQTPIRDHSIRLVHRPSLGHLRFDSGLVTDIDRPLLIGRKPTAEGLEPGDEVPGLVALPDPDGMLSRVHIEARIEGWEVLVVDRNSTNGTVIEVPGQAPVRLRPLEPVLITAGTRITLADAVGCTFETGVR